MQASDKIIGVVHFDAAVVVVEEFCAIGDFFGSDHQDEWAILGQNDLSRNVAHLAMIHEKADRRVVFRIDCEVGSDIWAVG